MTLRIVSMKLLTLLFLSATLVNCSSSGSSSGSSGGTTVDGDTAQISSSIGSITNDSISDAAASTGDASISSLARITIDQVKKSISRTDLPEVELECDDVDDDGTSDGTLTFSGSYTDNTFTFEWTASECAASNEISLSDGSTCSYDTVIDGFFGCTFVQESSTTATVTCDTGSSSPCDNTITVTLDGTDHTVGFAYEVSASALDTDTPTLTYVGTVCIDGTEYDIDDLDDFDSFTSDDLVCE